MDDQVLVGVTHGRAHLEEQLHALARARGALLEIPVDGFASDQLHDHVRGPGFGGAPVQHARDVRMLQAREDLALGAEALLGHGAAHIRAHELDRHFGLVQRVVAHGLEHLAHAAGTQEFHDAMGADALADAMAHAIAGSRAAGHRQRLGLECRRRRVQRAARLLVRRQQGFHFLAERRVAASLAFQQRRTLGGRRLQRPREQGFDPLPPVCGHFGVHERVAVSSRCSHARAIAHSRFTVASDTPTTPAVSSNVSPPK